MVVELDVVPVDIAAGLLVDLGVRARGVDGREPGRNRRMGDKVLSGGEQAPQRLSIRDEPLLRLAISLVDRSHVLVVDINALQPEVLDDLGVAVGERGGRETGGGRRVGGSEGGAHERDPRVVVGFLERGTFGGGEHLELRDLVGGALGEEEGEDQDVVALIG